MITLKREDYDRILAHAKSEAPVEACGLIGGVKNGDDKEIRKVYMGNWHSHPVSPSRPSQEDIRLAYDSSASYLILSLMEEEPVLNSFHIEEGVSQKEELVII